MTVEKKKENRNNYLKKKKFFFDDLMKQSKLWIICYKSAIYSQ